MISIGKLSEAFQKALVDPDVRNRFQMNYMDAVYQDPPTFGATVAESVASWKAMIAELGIEPK